MKQEAPTSFLPPDASQLKADRQQFQSRKRPYEENRGRGYFEHREDRRWVCGAAITLVPVGLSACSPVPVGAFILRWAGRQSRVLPALALFPQLFLHSLVRFNFAKLLILPVSCRFKSEHSLHVEDVSLPFQSFAPLPCTPA